MPVSWPSLPKKRTVAFTSALLALADGIVLASPAGAREPQYRLDIAAGPIDQSLALFAQATGISVGWNGTIANIRTKRLKGSLTAQAALARLLASSGLKARQVGPKAYRIERDNRPALTSQLPLTPNAASVPPSTAKLDIEPPLLADLVITGQKRSQRLSQVPMSLSVVAGSTLDTDRFAAGSRDLALSVDGLAVTNLGPGRNRQFIRGVADSPFNGPSQSTVAVELDDARVTFDAPDPDIRPIDLDRIEILKGPQGPLYGSGALGGIYHIVTRKPDLTRGGGSVRLLAEAVQHGSPGLGAEAVVNVPLDHDRLAIRAVGYVLHGGGWIDNLGRDRNANQLRMTGTRIALRWQPDPDWTFDVAGLSQSVKVADSQYVTLAHLGVRRFSNIPEPTDNNFDSSAITVRGRIGEVALLATSSYVDQRVAYALDSTAASRRFGLTGPSRFFDRRNYQIVNQELRLSDARSERWVAGLSYLDARSDNDATMTSATKSISVEALDRRVTEYAAFGEIDVPILSRVSATVGARLAYTVAENVAVVRSQGTRDRAGLLTFSPSVSCAWTPNDRTIVYLRYAGARRPGGLAPSGRMLPLRRFRSDTLETVDLGFRHDFSNEQLAIGAAMFFTDWSHIQSDFLLPNGLISTRNAGKAQIGGLEASIDWHPIPGLDLSAGATYLHARLVNTEAGLKITDRRLPIAPETTARLAVDYSFALGRGTMRLSAQGNYTGHARLAFDENLDRQMGNYAIAAAAASFSLGGMTLGARIDNISNVRGDSFAFGNPFSIMQGRQFTPLRPRTVTITITQSW